MLIRSGSFEKKGTTEKTAALTLSRAVIQNIMIAGFFLENPFFSKKTTKGFRRSTSKREKISDTNIIKTLSAYNQALFGFTIPNAF